MGRIADIVIWAIGGISRKMAHGNKALYGIYLVTWCAYVGKYIKIEGKDVQNYWIRH